LFFGLAPAFEPGFVPVVVVVVLFAVPVGAVDCGVVDAVVPFGEVVPDVEPAGVVAGAGVGNEVKGVGSGGNGASLEMIMKAWMESEGHRTNLLNTDYIEIGVGVARDQAGRIYVTQIFAYPRK